MLELTLNQQFDYRLISDTVTKMSDEQLLSQLKDAHSLLKQKTFILNNFLDTGTLTLAFMNNDDLNESFSRHMTYREFEKYGREQLIEVLLGTVKTLMYTDNHIKSCILG